MLEYITRLWKNTIGTGRATIMNYEWMDPDDGDFGASVSVDGNRIHVHYAELGGTTLRQFLRHKYPA